jgi:predicted methyltransferase
MRASLLLAGAFACAFSFAASAADQPAIAAAVADAGRPAADTQRDADRKPGEAVAFSGMKAGDKVIDLVPGSGYFTRIFSKVVGPKGKVYALTPDEMLGKMAKAADAAKALPTAGYANVVPVSTSINDIKVGEPVDIVWTSLNYHDMHNPLMGPANMGSYNKSVFNALKSGGIYIIIDHAAAPGSGTRDTELLHRIDVEAVKAEVTGVGFQLLGESKILAHPADDHSGKIFDSGVRGKTDQFVLKFKKP